MNPYSWRVTKWLNETSRNQTFFFYFTLAHTVALLLIFSSPCACISPLPHFHVGASSLVLISTHLYIACLSPHYTAVCATGKLRSGCCDFNTQLCLGREKERERKKAPLTDRQTPVRPCPLSLLCVRVRDVSKWQESEEGEEWEKIVGALFGPQGESARRMRGEAWGMEERALDWPLCWISPCYTNMRAVITYRAAAYGRESPSHAFTCTYTLSVN